ncbi:MAG: Mur ligase family protein [Bdellovibrionales bacterium]
MNLEFERIQTDFNALGAGDWFFPVILKGVDQHRLLPQALAKDIRGFAYEAGKTAPDFGEQIKVQDLREFLFGLAVLKRASFRGQVTVIAGSAGKSTVKEMVRTILLRWRANHNGTIHVSPDNQNTKIALATQMLRLGSECSIAAFELGARRPYDFVVPLGFLQPSIVALLNVGTAHLGEFGSKENLEEEKLSVLRAPTARTAVVYADDSRILRAARKAGKTLWTFGSSGPPIGSHTHVQLCRETGRQVVFKINGGPELSVMCSSAAPKLGLNACAAFAISLSMGVPPTIASEAMPTFQGVARRFQWFKWQDVDAVDDAFNASPESMRCGLKHLCETNLAEKKRILLVLGSMLELGPAEKYEHERVADLILELFSERIHRGDLGVATIGEAARHIAMKLVNLGFPLSLIQMYSEAEEARAPLAKWKSEFDLVYFKGSRGSNLSHIFPGGRDSDGDQ